MPICKSSCSMSRFNAMKSQCNNDELTLSVATDTGPQNSITNNIFVYKSFPPCYDKNMQRHFVQQSVHLKKKR